MALCKVFDPRFEWFKSRNIIITYHGSLQYNDPRDLDVDVEFMGHSLGFKDVKEMEREVENELEKPGVWPRENCDTNFGICSISKIKRDLKELEGHRYGPNSKEDRDLNLELEASLILSSKVLYESQRPQLEAIQEEVRRLITENQWLKEGVLHQLTGVVVVRQNRRK